MPVAFYLILATCLPLAGFLLLIFFGKRFAGLAGPFATTLIIGSFGLSVAGLVLWVANPEFNYPRHVEAFTYRWLSIPAQPSPAPAVFPLFKAPDQPPAPLVPAPTPPAAESARGDGSANGENPAGAYQSSAISIGYSIDSLTVALFAMVTFVAALVHLYSIAFMAGDSRLPRYFAYLGLLCSAMLALLLANSLVQFFVSWELVGAASFLLIGFWFERRGPAMAALKTFLVQRVGDLSLLLGIGILFLHVGAAGLNFHDAQGTGLLSDAVRNSLKVTSAEFLYFTGPGPDSFLGLHWLTWVGLLLFGGAAAKAAQFPLHVWLADATEAPLPASALINSATSVAAGVYLVARIYPILTMDVRLAIAVLGCTTLLLGALLALVQTDLKRLLAYFTISQLGYIMLFLATGGYSAGLIHLFTHAFFNAALFLAAGSVLHGLGTADLRQMGGLWRKFPVTAGTFVVAGCALIGVPFFSGAYSQHLGLAGVHAYARTLAGTPHAHAALFLYYIPAATAFLTALAMGRAGWLAFGGRNRNEDLFEHAHESFLMILPQALLALLTLNIYEFFGLPRLIVKSLAPFAAGGPPVAHISDEALQILSTSRGGYVFWAFLACLPAVALYWNGFGAAERLRRLPFFNLVHLWLRERMFFDALYNGLLVRAVLVLAATAAFIDRFCVDALVNFVALVVRAMARASANIDTRLVDGAVAGVGYLAGLGNKAALAAQQGRVRIYLLVTFSALAAAVLLIVAGHLAAGR